MPLAKTLSDQVLKQTGKKKNKAAAEVCLWPIELSQSATPSQADKDGDRAGAFMMQEQCDVLQ